MNRRHFLQAIGAGVAATAAGIELLELAMPKRTFFSPPAAIGWPTVSLSAGQFAAFIEASQRLIAETMFIPYELLRAARPPDTHFPTDIIRPRSARILSANSSFARQVSSDEARLT